MKKFFYLSALALGLMFTTTACSDDDTTDVDAKNLDYTPENASSWGNYMRVVAQLLVNDVTTLYDDWAVKYNEGDSYANFFKNQDALTSVEQLIDGCVDIANEVGTAKIGDPYALFVGKNEEKAFISEDGKIGAIVEVNSETDFVGKNEEKALYAVESWYSWHSREDYRNTIYSICNAYYGTRTGVIGESSLSKAVAAVNDNLLGIQNFYLSLYGLKKKSIMNTLELEAYKAELAREVLNINNQEVLDTIKDVIRKGEELTNTPYRMGVREARKLLQDSEKRFEEGEYVSEEEMEEFYNALQ